MCDISEAGSADTDGRQTKKHLSETLSQTVSSMVIEKIHAFRSSKIS